MKRTANSSFRNEVGVICVKNKTSLLGLTSRNKVMLMMTPPDIFGFIQFSVLLPHAVCSLQISYTDAISYWDLRTLNNAKPPGGGGLPYETDGDAGRLA